MSFHTKFGFFLKAEEKKLREQHQDRANKMRVFLKLMERKMKIKAAKEAIELEAMQAKLEIEQEKVDDIGCSIDSFNHPSSIQENIASAASENSLQNNSKILSLNYNSETDMNNLTQSSETYNDILLNNNSTQQSNPLITNKNPVKKERRKRVLVRSISDMKLIERTFFIIF